MSLDERFILAVPFGTYFVNKDTGQPLAGGKLYFYRDIARSEPKTVYQISGTPPDYIYTALPNPVTLSNVGTIQNATEIDCALYFYPYTGEPADNTGVLDLYYMQAFDANGSVTGVEQFTREGLPNLNAESDPSNANFPVQNQIANPQFTRVFVNENEATSYTVSGSTTRYAFAPDWEIELAGTGTVTVERVAVAGTLSVITSPPYLLEITVPTGVTFKLIQKLKVNSGLWGSTSDQDVYLSGAVVARNELVGNASITIGYTPSSGASTTIVSGTFNESEYSLVRGVTTDPMPSSTDANTGEDGFVEIYLQLSQNTQVRLTSVQVIPTLSSSIGNLVQYDANSSNREQALMGDWFIPALEAKPVPSMLTAWDFPLNPGQFGSSGTLAVAGSQDYIVDQTIASDTAGSVTWARDAITNGLQFTTVGTNNAFYMMQYLTGLDAKNILTNKLSVNVNAYRTQAGSDITMRVYLYRAASNLEPVRVATTANLTATYSNGSSGVGATLTNAAAMAAISIDGIALALNDRVLVKDQTSTFQNGVYTVTTVGSGAVNWVLTRATDFDEIAEIVVGAVVPVAYEDPTATNIGKFYAQTATVATIGTDAITFSQTGRQGAPLLPASIGSVSTAGVFSLNTNGVGGALWSEIPRNGLPTASATLNTVNTANPENIIANDNNYGFSQWQLTDTSDIGDTDKFAIVVTFAYTTASNVITVNSVSVTPGDIPTVPAPQSKKAVLDSCETYYERSYEIGTDTATATVTGSIANQQLAADLAGATALYPDSYQLEFKNTKDYMATTTQYPVIATTTANYVTAYAMNSTAVSAGANAATSSWVGAPSKAGISYVAVNNTVLDTIANNSIMRGWIRYHYVADARIGK